MHFSTWGCKGVCSRLHFTAERFDSHFNRLFSCLHAYFLRYAFINFSAIFATWGRLLLFNFSSVRASKSMFEHLLDVVMNAPMSFFDTTPIGRIGKHVSVSSFFKDGATLDLILFM